MPFPVGQASGPAKKVARSSNNRRLRHAEEQSMRTSRPPGMGRRCAPRRQLRPPSGDPHPDDGAMASRPSRRSITCPWRLSGSSGPRPRNWALGGLVRPVQKYKSLENALMPGRTVTHGGVRTPESAGRPRRPGVKTQGTVECFPRIAVVPVGGGGRSLSRPHVPMFHDCQSSAPASLRSPADCLHVAVTVRLRQGAEGRWSRAAERNAAKDGH